MSHWVRYPRLLLAFCRYGLARELAFRGNFAVKMVVELLWLGILLIFYRTVFARTSVVADWTESEYLFFVGCFFTLEGLIETLFLENFTRFAELIRSGDLDFYLLQPIDEQFLVSCHHFDWTTIGNVPLGIFIMASSLVGIDWTFDLAQLTAFLALFGCGLAMSYSFMLMLASTSVFFIRNQSLYELWWLFSSFMRYPKEIFGGLRWTEVLGWFCTFVVPVLLVVNVPARVMVKSLDSWLVAYTLAATVALLFVSRWFFRFALRRYRSASS
jgi:ABC-2 type transport system permease protein